ncbi:MAG: Hsp20/alpha crystallin family protein [Desulfarculaceae bacterium]|nr:Hsp20/alpha crystallin family protein [Desulfarculaceae bacterium]MCF8070796.1 Hsp20/alpha crystallin family protein [Desulfarculaceae bacterium]MCF8102233.1 Hsp20/alpha crystallin family protein [Desulfarculaceae bacterium]MCF8116968.1 Hsp20/alpha crystallin family protein [Desulfarculaceae bacterium]
MTYLIPYGQFRGLNRLRRDVDDLFSRFFTNGEGGGGGGLPAEGAFVPSLDVKESEGAYVVSAEVPGLKPEDIKVEYNDGVLTLSGEKKQEIDEEQGSWHVVERRYGSFSRGVRLPSEVDLENLKATHKDGVLTVSLPKSTRSSAKTIEVQAG